MGKNQSMEENSEKDEQSIDNLNNNQMCKISLSKIEKNKKTSQCFNEENDKEEDDLEELNSHAIKYKSTKKRLKNHHNNSNCKKNVNPNEIFRIKNKHKSNAYRNDEIELIVKKKLITTTTTTTSDKIVKNSSSEQLNLADNLKKNLEFQSEAKKNASNGENNENTSDNSLNKTDEQKEDYKSNNPINKDNENSETNCDYLDQNIPISTTSQTTINKKQIEYEFRLLPKLSSNINSNSKKVKLISFNSFKNCEIPNQIGENQYYTSNNCMEFLFSLFNMTDENDIHDNKSNSSKYFLNNTKRTISDNEIYQDKIIKINKNTNIVIKTSPVKLKYGLKRNSNNDKNLSDSTDTINNSKVFSVPNSNFPLISRCFSRLFCCCIRSRTKSNLINRKRSKLVDEEHFEEAENTNFFGNAFNCCFKTDQRYFKSNRKVIQNFSSLNNEINNKSSDSSINSKEPELITNLKNVNKVPTNLNKNSNKLNESSSNSNLNSHSKLSVRHSAASAESSNDEYMDNPPIKCIRVLRPSNDLTSVRFDSHFNIIQAVNNGSQIDLTDSFGSNELQN